MKKIYCLFLAFILSISLLGCSSTNKEDATYDTEFINSLSKALQKRWDLNNEYEKKDIITGSDEHYDYYEKLVNAELNELEKYKDLKFKDSKLQELAIKYINLLNQQKDSLQYLKVNYDKFDKEWMDAYNQRTQLIIKFTKDYNLTVDNKYKDTLNELLTNGKLVNEEEDLKAEIKNIVDSAEFKKVKEEYDWAYYEAVLENTTGKDFQYFTIEINLLDEYGVVVESTYAPVDNWKNNQKVKFQFSTDKKFKTMKFSSDYYIDEN